MKDLQEPAPLLGDTKVPRSPTQRDPNRAQSINLVPPPSSAKASVGPPAAKPPAPSPPSDQEEKAADEKATSGKASADLCAQGSGTRTPSGSSSSGQPDAKKRPRPKNASGLADGQAASEKTLAQEKAASEKAAQDKTGTKHEKGRASSSNSEKTPMPAPLCASEQEDQKENQQNPAAGAQPTGEGQERVGNILFAADTKKAIAEHKASKGLAYSRDPIRLHHSVRSGFTPSPHRNPATAAASPGHIHATAPSTTHNRMQVAAPTMRPPPDPPPASAGQSKEIQKKDATELLQRDDDDKGDEEGGNKDDKNKTEKDDTSAGFTFSMDVVYDKDAKTNDQNDDKKDGKKDDKQDNDKGDEKEPDPHAAKRTAPQDQEHAAQRRATCSKDADAKTTTHPLEQATAVDKESCILKIFHMSLRSYNCLKQFLGFPKHYLILEIFICVNEESQRARA